MAFHDTYIRNTYYNAGYRRINAWRIHHPVNRNTPWL